MTKKLLTGLTVQGPISIDGTTSPLLVNSSTGSSGQVLTSTGTGSTPSWQSVTVDATTIYPGSIWTNNSNYALDFSGSATGQSILGSTTRGYSLAVGYTYEFETYFMVGMSFLSSTTMSLSFSWDVSTISGSPTSVWSAFHSVSTSTISGASASPTQSRNSGSGVTIVTAVTTGSRFATVIAKGQIRVSGTGALKIFPKITPSAVGDNGVTIYSNYWFKVNRIGTDAITSIGSWTT